MHPYEMAATMRTRGQDESIKLNYGSLYTVVEIAGAPGSDRAEGARAGRSPARAHRVRDHRSGPHRVRRLAHRAARHAGQGVPAVRGRAHADGRAAARATSSRCSRSAARSSSSSSRCRSSTSMLDVATRDGVPRVFLVEVEYERALRRGRARVHAQARRATSRRARSTVSTNGRVPRRDGPHRPIPQTEEGEPMNPIVEVEGVERSFGETHALCGRRPRGARRAASSRCSDPTARARPPRAHPLDVDPARRGHRPRRRIRRGEATDRGAPVIGLAGQYAAVDDTLTGRENLEMIGRLSRLSKRLAAKARAQEVLERVSLTDAADRQLKTYSGGMRRRIDLGAGLVARPRVLLLDEPTTGLDPANRHRPLGVPPRPRERGRDASCSPRSTSRRPTSSPAEIVVIDHGRVIAVGHPARAQAARSPATCSTSPSPTPTALDRARRALDGVGRTRSDRRPRRRTECRCPSTTGRAPSSRRCDDSTTPASRLVDLALRRPSLDDVFLTLTGHTPRTVDGDERETAGGLR